MSRCIDNSEDVLALEEHSHGGGGDFLVKGAEGLMCQIFYTDKNTHTCTTL